MFPSNVRTYVQKWSAGKKNNIKIEPRIYVLFVLQLDDKCKIDKKTLMIKEMFFAATLFG